MGFFGFLQRHETNNLLRQQRNARLNTEDAMRDIDSFLSAKMWQGREPKPVSVRIKTPNKTFSVQDATDRPITINVPFTYETVTDQGELVEKTKIITIELDITRG